MWHDNRRYHSACQWNGVLPNADDNNNGLSKQRTASDRGITRPAGRISVAQRHSSTRCTAGDEYQALAEYYIGYADYRLGVVVYRMDKEKAIVYLDSAVDHLARAIEKENDFAEAHALLSSCYGIKISFAPFKAIVLGPKSGMEMQKAKNLSPENPRIALLGAIGTYNTPALFGGGKEKGLDALKKAAELFDRWNTADSLRPDWGAAEVYAWIGLAYVDRNETILARKAFENALRINPDYGWVKYELLPKVTSQSGLQ